MHNQKRFTLCCAKRSHQTWSYSCAAALVQTSPSNIVSTETSEQNLEPSIWACLSQFGFRISPRSIVSIENSKRSMEAWAEHMEHYKKSLSQIRVFRVLRDFRAAGSSGARVRFLELGNLGTQTQKPAQDAELPETLAIPRSVDLFTHISEG